MSWVSHNAWAERLLTVIRVSAMLLWTFGMVHAALLALRLHGAQDSQELRNRWVRQWANGLLRVFGVQPVWGSHAHAVSEACVVVANHRSPLDILLLLGCFGGSVVARHDLERWPILGWAARSFDTIFVDRTDALSGGKAIREVRRRVAACETVILFPEGTTHDGDKVRSFHGGAFVAVRGLQVRLVPVGIAYEPGCEFVGETFTEHLMRVTKRRSTRVAVRVGPYTQASGDRRDMAAQMHSAVEALVREARGLLTLSQATERAARLL